MTANIKLILISLVLMPPLNFSLFAQTKTALKITAVRAQLFYDTKGTFSSDVLAKKDFAFWNTIIGKGDAGFPSSSTFVTVEVSGTDHKGDLPKVELTATGNKGKLLLKKMIDVDLLGRTQFYAPFWLYNTGCEPIKLSARLIGKNVSAKSLIKTIPFACGE